MGPILIAGILIIPIWLEKIEKERTKNVAIIDESFILGQTVKDFENYHFTNVTNVTVEELRKDFSKSGFDAVLFIPKNIYSSNMAVLYSNVWVDNALKAYVGYSLRRDLEYMALMKEKVTIETIKRVATPVFVGVQKWTKEGSYIDEESTLTKKSTIAFTAAMIIYLFIFMYGILVLRGVIEEKSSRVVEIVISSVKPIQLMAGKILGIGSVGLVQFLLWIVLTFSIVSGAQVLLFPETYNPSPMPELSQTLGHEKVASQMVSTNTGNIEYAVNLFQSLDGINWPIMLLSFVFFFVFGYLLYACLFAGVGSLLDQDSETQQFVIPITLPLILSLILLNGIIANPTGQIAFWFSMFPLTSPIVMMARIPFGVPYWEITLSAVILIGTSFLAVKFASKMYRSGLLMYGKKVSIFTIFGLLRK